jgi:hypothetical protein
MPATEEPMAYNTLSYEVADQSRAAPATDVALNIADARMSAKP